MKQYFARLPKLTQLTRHQRIAVDSINAISISGLAGSGKSVCLVYRYISRLKSNNANNLPKRYAYITYTKTLRAYTIRIVELENLKIDEIYCAMSFNPNGNYEEIIVDEAQDLPIRVLQKLNGTTRSLSIGADFNQQIYENRVVKSEIKNLLPNNTEYELNKVFRNSFNILIFITKNWHPTLYTPEELERLKRENLGRKPTLCIGKDFIFDIIAEYGDSATHNIAILFFKKASVESYHKLLEQKNIAHTYYYSKDSIANNTEAELSTLHITTFASSKGLEFDTVIIPDFEEYEKYFIDFKTIKKSQLKSLYVAITRAKNNLYLVANKEITFLKDSNTYDLLTYNNEDLDDEIPF